MSPVSIFAHNSYRKKWKYHNELIIFNIYGFYKIYLYFLQACKMLFLKCFVYILSSCRNKRITVIELRNENEQILISYTMELQYELL